jgi:hypothetical protein
VVVVSGGGGSVGSVGVEIVGRGGGSADHATPLHTPRVTHAAAGTTMGPRPLIFPYNPAGAAQDTGVCEDRGRGDRRVRLRGSCEGNGWLVRDPCTVSAGSGRVAGERVTPSRTLRTR